jgi:predicted GNAT family N-acyltransferase
VYNETGYIVGLVLCSYDGLQGYLQQLVVAAELRGGGLGKQLISAALAALQVAGCLRVSINCHPYLAEWYEKQGFIKSASLNYCQELLPAVAGKNNSPVCD